MNALMLLIALRLCGRPLQIVRLAAAAAFGACTAFAVRWLCPGWSAALWLPAAMGMMGIACGRSALYRPFRSAAMLFCAGGLLGGVVLALSGSTGSLAAAYPIAAGCALWAVLSANRERRQKMLYTDVRIECGGVRMRAIIDSGNTLRDYLTGRPVIVLPENSCRAKRMISGLPERLIFADTAGGRQMMRMAVPGCVMLMADGTWKSVLASVALAPALDARSPALVPAALLGEEG